MGLCWIGIRILRIGHFPIQKIVNPYISGLSEDWATNSQQQLIKQGKTLHKEKKNLCSCKGVLCLIIGKSKDKFSTYLSCLATVSGCKPMYWQNSSTVTTWCCCFLKWSLIFLMRFLPYLSLLPVIT